MSIEVTVDDVAKFLTLMMQYGQAPLWSQVQSKSHECATAYRELEDAKGELLRVKAELEFAKDDARDLRIRIDEALLAKQEEEIDQARLLADLRESNKSRQDAEDALERKVMEGHKGDVLQGADPDGENVVDASLDDRQDIKIVQGDPVDRMGKFVLYDPILDMLQISHGGREYRIGFLDEDGDLHSSWPAGLLFNLGREHDRPSRGLVTQGSFAIMADENCNDVEVRFCSPDGNVEIYSAGNLLKLAREDAKRASQCKTISEAIAQAMRESACPGNLTPKDVTIDIGSKWPVKAGSHVVSLEQFQATEAELARVREALGDAEEQACNLRAQIEQLTEFHNSAMALKGHENMELQSRLQAQIALAQGDGGFVIEWQTWFGAERPASLWQRIDQLQSTIEDFRKGITTESCKDRRIWLNGVPYEIETIHRYVNEHDLLVNRVADLESKLRDAEAKIPTLIARIGESSATYIGMEAIDRFVKENSELKEAKDKIQALEYDLAQAKDDAAHVRAAFEYYKNVQAGTP